MSRRTASLCLLLVLMSVPRLARAEWLYFKDGATQEIKGPWKVRGRMVQFTTRNGTLQMVATEEIDLPVSEKMSLRARPSNGLSEIRGGPDSRKSGTVVNKFEEVVSLDVEWDLVLTNTVVTETLGGESPAQRCVTAAGLAVTEAGGIVVQIGTTIETVELYGLRSIAPQALAALVEGQPLCLMQKALQPGRDENGRYRAHALTKDGVDVGLELIRQAQAQPSAEPHAYSADYKRAFDARNVP